MLLRNIAGVFIIDLTKPVNIMFDVSALGKVHELR